MLGGGMSAKEREAQSEVIAEEDCCPSNRA